MKQKLLIFLFTILSSSTFGQTNPEDIIIVYDSLNPSGKIILKSKLASNLDSLSTHLVDDKRTDLLTKKDSSTLKKLLIGDWKLESAKRVNGKTLNIQTPDQIRFEEKIQTLSRIISNGYDLKNFIKQYKLNYSSDGYKHVYDNAIPTLKMYISYLNNAGTFKDLENAQDDEVVEILTELIKGGVIKG